MQTFFSHIIQESFSHENEDVVTDALTYILNISEIFRSGIMKRFQSIEQSIPEPHFQSHLERKYILLNIINERNILKDKSLTSV